MNQPSRCSTWSFVAVLTCALMLWSGLPLMASPQSSQSTSTSAAQNGDNPLPEAPQPQSGQSQQATQAPTGAAGAKAAEAKGAPAAQPIGAAVAPPRQRGHRSLLIKVGLAAGAAVAVGTVVALSAKSPARPTGTTSSTR